MRCAWLDLDDSVSGTNSAAIDPVVEESDAIDDSTSLDKDNQNEHATSNLNLTEHYNAIMSHHVKLQSLAGNDPKFKVR